MPNPLILFGENHPDVYLLQQIYDPDVDGSNPSSSGKIVPAVGSIVVDNNAGGLNYTLWIVHSVHPVTYKCVLVPARIVYDDDLEPDKILSYGNDVYVLYFDNRVSPTRLIIDSKIVILGTNSAEYKLVKTYQDGSKHPISVSVDADGSNVAEFTVENIGTIEDPIVQSEFLVNKSFATSTFIVLVWINDVKINENLYTAVVDPLHPGKVKVTLSPSLVYGVGASVVMRLYSVSDRAPVISTPIEGVRRCSNSYTTTQMVDGELVSLEIYDSAGVMTTRLQLVARHATVLNDFESSSNPIVAFIAKANQEKLNGDWVLYTDQSPERLAIYPEIIFANGSKQMITVDYLSTFAYGLEDINTNIPGLEFPVLIKKFLSPEIPSLIGEVSPNGSRFLTLDKKVVIEPRGRYGISKISIIPIWSTSLNRWTFKYYAYYINRNAYLDVTDDITYISAPLDGTLLNVRQNITIQVPQTMIEGDVILFEQVISIVLRSRTATVPYEFSNVQPPAVPPFIPSTTVYGIQDMYHNKPIVNYDSLRQQYFIPTSLFPNVSKFLEPFFIHAEPPYIPATETESPTPTHFILRDVDTGRSLTTTAITMDDFYKAFTLITITGHNEFLNKTVIVEFLLKQGPTYLILYGVPVHVVAGTYNPQ